MWFKRKKKFKSIKEWLEFNTGITWTYEKVKDGIAFMPQIMKEKMMDYYGQEIINEEDYEKIKNVLSLLSKLGVPKFNTLKYLKNLYLIDDYWFLYIEE